MRHDLRSAGRARGPTLALGVFLVVVAGCRAEAPPAAPAVSPSTLREILMGTAAECAQNSDCASGVCDQLRCVTLARATQGWMERALAERIRPMIQRDPSLAAALRGPLADELLERDDPYVASRLAALLGLLADPSSADRLRTLAGSPTELIRVRATVALGRLGDAAAFPRVRALLSHRSVAVALQATDALGAYLSGALAPTAVEALARQLENPDQRVRHRAVQVLGSASAAKDTAVKALRALLDRPGQEFLRYDATRALDRLGALN